MSEVQKPKDLTKEPTPSVSAKEEAKKRWETLEQEERKMVRGKFVYLECPNGIMEFNFRKYKNIPMEKYSLKDGEVYNLPLSVARHLNNNTWFPSYTFKNDEAGRPQSTVSEKIHRTSFQSLEFS